MKKVLQMCKSLFSGTKSQSALSAKKKRIEQQVGKAVIRLSER
jgi:hypothetical protein